MQNSFEIISYQQNVTIVESSRKEVTNKILGLRHDTQYRSENHPIKLWLVKS